MTPSFSIDEKASFLACELIAGELQAAQVPQSRDRYGFGLEELIR
jgi:hypothetical protein